MSEELLTLTGMTKDELADRAVRHLVRELLYGSSSDDDDDDDGPAPTRFAEQLRKQARLAVDQGVREIAEKHVMPHIGPLLEGLFLQPTNRWGESEGKGETFVEHITRMAREYYAEPVDYNGKARSEARGDYCDWRERTTRGVYIVHKYLYETIDKTLKELLKDAGGLLAGGIEAAIKDSLADITRRLKVRAEVPR